MVTFGDIVFLLLAGGQSRRMGGGDKNLLELAGKPLMAHVIDRVVPDDAILVINANGDASRYAQFNLPVIPDVIDGFAGPLAGVLTGLEWATANHPACTHVITLATDAPFLPTDLASRLVRAVNEGGDMAQAESGGRRHPVFAIWPTSQTAALRAALIDEGLRKIDHYTARFDCRVVCFDGEPDPFTNVNTPEDFATAQALLAE
jgi:molybdopterin-guanine dinucleotide biosynthesis protein A